jgi:hypothetical protein
MTLLLWILPYVGVVGIVGIVGIVIESDRYRSREVHSSSESGKMIQSWGWMDTECTTRGKIEKYNQEMEKNDTRPFCFFSIRRLPNVGNCTVFKQRG